MTKNKNGSALLIVLGFLSFMVVSAVSFSIWMRNERMPSSAVRRGMASKHLLEAALAGAISELDYAIEDDPFPGVHYNGPTVNSKSRSSSSNEGNIFQANTAQDYYDYWKGRVFMPPKPYDIADNSDSNVARYPSWDDTISVMTLEGLGYVPPPLVNEARFLGRRSWTSYWKDLNYGAGRYAYVALNVSDFFDINRIHATNRTSDVSHRVSISHLFAQNTTSFANLDTGAMNQFENFIANPGESDTPLVSILDYNLALGQKGGIGNIKPYFADFVGGNAGSPSFYNSDTNQVWRQPFVTDSWFPSTNLTYGITTSSANGNYVLTDPNTQPFLSYNYNSFLDLFKTSLAGTGDSMNVLEKQLRAVGVACLYDYLDGDDVPISLALPTTEMVPMITGVGLAASGVQVKFSADVAVDQPNPLPESGTYTRTITLTHKLAGIDGQLVVNASAVFPFKHSSERAGSYKVQALVRAFFAEDGSMKLRMASDALRPTLSDWQSNGTKFDDSKCYWTAVSTQTGITLPSDPEDPEDTLITIPAIPIRLNQSATVEIGQFNRKDEITIHKDGSTSSKSIQGDSKVDGHVKFFPYDADGNLMTEQSVATYDSSKLQFAVWVRIVNDEGKTVDMAPAYLMDDELNGKVSSGQLKQLLMVAKSTSGELMPLFDFHTKASDNNFEALPYSFGEQMKRFWNNKGDIATLFGATGAGGGKNTDRQYTVDLSSDWGALYCYDPRYNFAPEDWYATADKGITPTTWYNNVKSEIESRDGDIFMFVSDQEYLQSIGELSFIPRVQGLTWGDTSGGGTLQGDFFDAARYNGNSLRFSDRMNRNLGNAANNQFFWRTYRLYSENGQQRDPLYELSDGTGTIVDDNGSGYKINPYTDNQTILLAAFANTPYDYYAASTNTEGGVKEKWTTSQYLNHCFNDTTKGAKITAEEMRKIASKFSSAMRAKNGGDWQAAYDDLWNGGEDLFSDVNETTIDTVDRKFLCSYWRNCFANRQQLFLVFLRAESTVLGGVNQCQSPAQLGGRAVALVWRDPLGSRREIGSETRKIHRTRVLFYHQFE